MDKVTVPFVNLGLQFERFQKEIVDKFISLSSNGNYILGSEVDEFERLFSQSCDTSHALGVANCTDAITIVLKALGVDKDTDEVITTPNTFIGTAGAIVMAGAKPRFVDVGSDYNLDPGQLEKAINKNTKAILPIHLTGMPADMDPILAIAARYNLPVIEDCAQAIGATYKGKPVGSMGIAGCFSLHPLKNLHVHGDGGAITTNDSELYQKMRLFRSHGLINRDESLLWGINSRLDAIQAAIANIKLRVLPEITKRFQEIAHAYDVGLAPVKNEIALPLAFDDRRGVYHNYVLRVRDRQKLQEHLLKNGIETKIHYPIALHLQPAARGLGYKLGDFPESERQAQEILSLPIYPELTTAQVQWVNSKIVEFFS